MSDASYSQVLVMAAIVATLLLVPAAGIAWLVSMLLGLPFASLVTFGASVGALTGLFAWWGIFFVLAVVYAAGMRTIA